MPTPSPAFVDIESDALEEMRRAILVLADRQTAVLEAIGAQGVRLDALAEAVRASEAQATTANGLLTEIAEALDGKSQGGMKDVVDALDGMAADVRELTQGTATMAEAVTLLAGRIGPAEG